jgi:hypothetical protein
MRPWETNICWHLLHKISPFILLWAILQLQALGKRLKHIERSSGITVTESSLRALMLKSLKNPESPKNPKSPKSQYLHYHLHLNQRRRGSQNQRQQQQSVLQKRLLQNRVSCLYYMGLRLLMWSQNLSFSYHKHQVKGLKEYLSLFHCHSRMSWRWFMRS